MINKNRTQISPRFFGLPGSGAGRSSAGASGGDSGIFVLVVMEGPIEKPYASIQGNKPSICYDVMGSAEVSLFAPAVIHSAITSIRGMAPALLRFRGFSAALVVIGEQ